MLSRPLRVGISYFGRREPQSIWANGAVQNCFFLYWLFQRCPGVGEVWMVNAGDGEAGPGGVDMAAAGVSVIGLEAAMGKLDLLIEMGAQLGPETVERARAQGARVIAYRVGNDYVMEIERVVAGKNGTGIFNGVRFDEIWTNPQHARTCRSFFETVYRCPVRIVPHIWDSFFIDKLIGELPSGLRFGYAPGAQDKRIAIFEPNINVVKTAHYPMLVCEAAYRQNPSGIGDIFVTNAIDLKRHEAFERFALGLDIVQAGKASFEARFSTPYFLARFTDVVVTHQWENGLNYLYYDAAYGRYPLVHNSDLLAGFGYQYASFDARDGARALREAVRQHDARLEEYEQACQALLDGVSIRNAGNVTAYDALLRGVCGGAGLAPAVA